MFAYILSPDTSEGDGQPSGVFLYPGKVQSMASTVATILGIPIDQVQKNTYAGVDKERAPDVLKTTAAGHMIFDYDPKGGLASTRRTALAAWRIIWQRSQILADQWDPAPPSTTSAAAR